jgi:hypothetical protein
MLSFIIHLRYDVFRARSFFAESAGYVHPLDLIPVDFLAQKKIAGFKSSQSTGYFVITQNLLFFNIPFTSICSGSLLWICSQIQKSIATIILFKTVNIVQK